MRPSFSQFTLRKLTWRTANKNLSPLKQPLVQQRLIIFQILFSKRQWVHSWGLLTGGPATKPSLCFITQPWNEVVSRSEFRFTSTSVIDFDTSEWYMFSETSWKQTHSLTDSFHFYSDLFQGSHTKVHFVLGCLLRLISVFNLAVCFLRGREWDRTGWVGRWGGSLRSRGRGNCVQNIHYEKIFSIKKRTKQNYMLFSFFPLKAILTKDW